MSMTDFEKFLLYSNLKKSRGRWRFVAVVLLLVFAVGYFWQEEQGSKFVPEADHIARISFKGMILESAEQTKRLHKLAENPHVKGVLVEIDSPGGTMTGGLSAYENLRTIAGKKPVVAVMKTIAASGGYMAALGADYIVASEATLTGSIGVLLPLLDATELAKKVGVKSENYASGKLKANTSPLDERTAEDKAYLQDMVNELNKTFYAYVEKSRPTMTPEQIAYMKDGRAVVGTQALALNLIDALGNEETAKKWLETKLEKENLPIKDYELWEEEDWWAGALFGLLPSQLQGVLGSLQKPAVMASPAMWAVLQ